jgi:NitT/TauT family transport system substrate-binding protein
MQAALAQETITVRVALVPAIPALAVWVAQDEGFFKAQGLEVQVTPVANVSLIPAILGKQFDIGTATTVDLIMAAAGGLNVAAISGGHFETEQAMTNALVAGKQSGVRNVKDLAGKTVATPSIGAILQVAQLHWLKKEGIDVRSVHFVEMPFPTMGDQLAAGRIDAAIAAEPFASRMVAAGNTSLGNELLQVANPSLATLWISDRGWALANRPTVVKWTTALRQAAAFIVQQPNEARDILAKYTKLPSPVVEHLALPHFETKVQPSDLDVWIKVLVELDEIQKPMDAATLLATAN